MLPSTQWKQARLCHRSSAPLRHTRVSISRCGLFTNAFTRSSRQTTHITSSSSSSSSSSSGSSSSESNSRRQALLGLLSTSVASQAAAAWAKPALLDLPACRKFKQAGPIAFCELKQGSGDSPLPGDLIVVDYTARAVANDNEVYDSSRNFKFTVGNGEMIPGFEIGILGSEDGSVPPIKEGGSRTLLIPPELAYGALGDGCLFGRADNCRIPPNSAVEITFQYRGLGY